MNGVELAQTSSCPPASSSCSNDNAPVEAASFGHSGQLMDAMLQDSHELTTDFGAPEENSGGMTKIIPSNIDVRVIFCK